VSNGQPGRPTDYRPEYDRQAEAHCLLGGTDADLARLFDVAEATIQNWKAAHPSFLASIRAGRDGADEHVAKSLYGRAVGYSHAEDKIFQYEGQPVVVPTVKHYPPDTQAASLWLRNRQPARWRDRLEHSLDPDSAKTLAELFVKALNE
jgi:hypothetical protein